MSLNMRYIILTIIFLGISILFVFSPAITGMVTEETINITTNCVAVNNYYDCVQCCQANADSTYGEALYGITQWNSVYNGCWNNYCQKFSN